MSCTTGSVLRPTRARNPEGCSFASGPMIASATPDRRPAPGDGLIKVSDLIIEHPEVQSFKDLKRLVMMAARSGYRFLQFDVKPEFVDTPRNWDLVLEAVFYQGDRTQS